MVLVLLSFFVWSVFVFSFFVRELQAEHQPSQSFQEKCKNLTSIQKKLEEESVSKKPLSYSSLQEMLTVHQVQYTFSYFDILRN